MEGNDWKTKYVKSIQDCKNAEEIGNVVEKIYGAGFQDGHEEGINEEDKESFGAEPPEPLPYHDLD